MFDRSRALMVGATLAITALGAPALADSATSSPTSDSYMGAQGLSAWVLPAGSYSGNRLVDLSGITPATVKGLKPAWRFKMDDDSPIETSPIVWNGMMYVTSAHDHVYALDAKTGALKWEFKDDPHVIAFAANRGVALMDGKVFLGTLDGHLIALDAATGAKVWDVVGVDDTANSFFSMQPVPYKNMLLMGVSNGDWGGVGAIYAIDPKDGHRIWAWSTVPGPGEPGHDTWAGDSWKRGGAALWSGVALDPNTGMLYADLGNPQPDFYADSRKGINLYSDSMVALDISGSSPKLKWYHQFIPTDTHDWDPAMPPVRFTGMVGGKSREMVAAGDKAGNFWLLDANDGKLISQLAVSHQSGQSTQPDLAGDVACPNTNGGVEYNGGSFDPATNTFFVPSVDECGLWKKSPTATYVAGQFYLGGGFPKLVGPNTGWMNAVDVSTGKFVWREHQSLPALGGALTTTNGLVFTGMTTGAFDAFDAKTGAVVWSDDTGSPIIAPPVAYSLGGKEYVTVASGQAGNQQVPEMPKTSPNGSFVTSYALP